MIYDCKNCNNTGWVSCMIPFALPMTGAISMRERINPCHICNSGGSWSLWAQDVVDQKKTVSE